MGNIIFCRGEFSSIFGCTAQGSRGLLLFSVLHETTPFLTASEEGIQRWMPGGQSCVKEEKKKKMDGGDSIPGNVHEEQEDVEIVKVDCMCVKKE